MRSKPDNDRQRSRVDQRIRIVDSSAPTSGNRYDAVSKSPVPGRYGAGWERRNGKFVLQVAGHPNYGVPFGQDRIVPIFLATLAVQQSQTIRFRTASEMLKTFGMSNGGKEYRRLIAAFERVFGATIFFGTETITAKAKVVQRSRFNFFREARIWYNRTSDHDALEERFENVIVLSDEFFQEVAEHPIPTDLEVVKFLSAAPAVLDLFVWLSYRCFTAKEKEAIPIFGPFGLVQQLGAVEVCPTTKVSGKAAATAKDHPPRLAGMPSEHQPRWSLFAGQSCNFRAAGSGLGAINTLQGGRGDWLSRNL